MFPPTLCTKGPVVQQSNIATRLGKRAVTQDTRFEAQRMDKEEKVGTSVTTWLGEDRMQVLLNLTGYRNKAELNGDVPIYF